MSKSHERNPLRARGRAVATAAAISGLAVLALPAAAFAESGSAEAQIVAEIRIPSVTTALVTTAEVVGRTSITGTLVARSEVLVFPQVSGFTIDEMLVDVGDRVTSGQVLAKVNSRTLDAQLAQALAERARAEAAVRQAQSQIASAQAAQVQAAAALARAEQLAANGSVSQASLDQTQAAAQTAEAGLASAQDGDLLARANLQQAEALVEIAGLNLSHATITAPVGGLISARNGQIGAITAMGGEPIFRLIEDGLVEVEAAVIETALGQIAEGNMALLDVAGVGEVTGSVRLIAPTVDRATRLGIIRIAVEAGTGLRAGTFADGWIVTDRHQGLTVPTTAVLTDEDRTYVLVVKDGVLSRQDVVAGLIWQDRREIVSGLAEQDVVVARAGPFFGDGDRIVPVPVSAAGENK